ncbi:MAG: hypothetical protein ABW007_18740 [Chitinophagaceae bacterium]
MHFYFLRSATVIINICAIWTLSSCKDQSQEEAFLSSLDKTIMQSTQNSRYKMEDEMALLLEKTYEPCSREKAAQWLPIARKVEHFTIDLSSYILNLKQQVKKNGDSPPSLYDSLKQYLYIYKDSICSSNEMIKHQFGDRFYGLDTLQTKKADLATQLQLLQTADPAQTPLLLTQIQHSIMQIGTSMVSFCRENTGCIIDRFDTYSAIIGQSSNVVLPGQTVEITAGIGSFTKTASAKITINGKPCLLQEDGAARYTLAASRIPGKYTLPVKIDYVDQDGIKRLISTSLTYQVFNSK